MATMIPESIPGDAPDSERRIFNLLRDDPAADNWVALWSLRPGQRNLQSGRRREVDFLILIPKGGAICLEVKGGQFDLRNGQWHRAGDAETMENPARQSEAAMHRLRQEIGDEFNRKSRENDRIKAMPMDFAVAFTDWEWPEGLRRDTPLIYDRAVVNAPGALARQIANDAKLLSNPVARGVAPIRPTVDTIGRLVNYLAPNIMTAVTLGSQLGDIDEKLISLTLEQTAVLDMVKENRQCLVKGSAGTGKTFLAVEYARRAGEAGLRVGLLGYTVLLGEYLKRQAQNHAGITSASFWPDVIRPLILGSPWAGEFQRDESAVADEEELYADIYPRYAKLAAADAGPQFDVLVVDEAPDLCRPPYLELMDALLAGGLGGGRWAMFGDFANQSIFPGGALDPESALLEYGPHPARLTLTVNCRNTASIARDVARITGAGLPETRPIAGPPPAYQYWNDAAELSDLLDETVSRFLANGVGIGEIAVLSRRRLENCGLDTARAYGGGHRLATYFRGQRVGGAGDDGLAALNHYTIGAFKGMEIPAAILILDSSPDRPEPESERIPGSGRFNEDAYIGMSRARGALAVLAQAGLRGELEARLSG